MSRRARAARVAMGSLAGAALLVGHPATAAAHLVTTGMGPVYDGAGHLFLTPEDLVPVLAIALFAGLRGPAAGRRAMFLMPPAWLMGGLIGSVLRFGAPASTPALSFLVLGGLVASDLRAPVAWVSGLAVIVGLVHGFGNGAVLRDGAGTLGLIGIVAMSFVVVTLVAASVVSLRVPWMRIAVRVAGSWIAAVGLLMFGWALR